MAKKNKDGLTSVPANPAPTNDWEAEGHANDLMRAGEVLTDPDKMKKAMKHLKKKKRAIKSVNDLVKFRNDKFGAKPDKNLQVDNDMDTDDVGI